MADAEDLNADEALVRRYAAGDAQAFEVLYRRHEMRVWRYLRRSLDDPATADDVMQDVWFAVARTADAYRPTARFTTWLLTLAHNRLVDVWRASRAARRADARDPADVLAELPAPATSEPGSAAESRDEALALFAAIGQLPPEQRDVFLLQAEGGLSIEEIAAVTAVSFETAKSRLRYARTKLRQLLGDYA
jgi:RNA polymerase sigma-70 factor (ECF subfamily)